ncbi:MAG: DUF4340 domain-containing protein [Desulfarculaceae bacterium]|nr:DUF4340 domain-containing protein [Desulfarculaceae bacterium]MCF8046731.1 DUF4340 domain-containing protein [Desulfarculaceae bacterium]MCF8096987.1 DUF4340 domain-containing protein [Desulfarculaceae bacterium]MCF8122538.1 DUF4340 domain-containing protein [Desulfarculaceae bacterium]
MNARRVTIWLVFLAVAVALYFLSGEVDRRSQEHEREANRIVQLDDPLNVQSLRVSGTEVPKAMVIERRDKEHRWEMVKPVVCAADGMQVGQMLSTVLESQMASRISDPGDLKQFGLEPPAFKLVLTSRGGGKAELLVGHLSPTKEFAYATAPGADEVWLVPPLVRGAINRSLFEMRDKAVLDFVVSAVNKVELNTGGQVIRLAREKAGAKPVWRFEGGGEADPSAVEDMLFMVHGMMAVDILDQGIYPEKMGLTKPSGGVVLELEGGGKKGLVIGGKVTGRDERYVRRMDGGPVMVVQKTSLERFGQMNRFKLSQRRVFRMERDDVVALSVERGGQAIEFAKQGGRWVRTQPPGDEKSGEAASLLVWDLVNLKWIKLLGTTGLAGLDKPSIVIKLTIKPPATPQGQAATVTVKQLVLGQVDKASGLLGAQIKGDDRVFGLDAGLLKGLPTLPKKDTKAPAGPK